jgi:hypothetical protein
MGTLRSAFVVAVSALGVCCALPGAVSASATIEPPPKQSPSSELPDGRVYELVSPANKHGNQAGAASRLGSSVSVLPSIASPDGGAVAFGGTGPAGEINASGLSENFIAERIANKWNTRSVVARLLKLNEETAVLESEAIWSDYSPDLSHVAYRVFRGSIPAAPNKSVANIYLMGSQPLAEPMWLLQSAASPSMENDGGDSTLLGMTPDANVVYFSFQGHLLAQDAARAGWGIYESRHGQVSEVGVLPDGSVPATGAFPAAAATALFPGYSVGEVNPASSDNQVSEDGRRLFFFSSGQLYVHELEINGSERSVLVSASQLPGHAGEGASDGVALFENRTKWNENLKNEFKPQKSAPTYAYASPDGSHVIFQSVDQLTIAAPGDGSLKVYDYDVDAGSLEYLPGVSLGGVVTSAKDGSSFMFVDGSVASPELDLWMDGLNGGSVRQIAQLPERAFVGPGRMVADSAVIVFQAQGPISGVGNSTGEQVYRYDVDSNRLSCISCSPSGTLRSGNAYISTQDQYQSLVNGYMVNDPRGVSSDGKRIFFATPNALVSRDTNGDFDTYEWENGSVFLISSGTGSNYSPFLDNSESGGDVFFAASDELVEGDNDQSFDVYDARIPRPGDHPPPAAVPCSGDVCQGPPSVAQLLSPPPSATFSGAGNLIQEPVAAARSRSKSSTRAGKLAVALRLCRKHKLKSRRIACEKRERKRYAASGTTAKRNGGRSK